MKHLALILLLAGCAARVSPVSDVVARGAANARAAAVKTNDPAAADALNNCAGDLESCEASCRAEVATAERQAWNRGAMWGGGIGFILGAIAVILVAFALRKKE